jgi:DNA topoisomerase IA
MSKNLVIVESPAKAKTIEGFLGKDYTVRSSFGHVRDLVKKGYGIDVEKNFTPTYEVQPEKEKVIAELKRLSKTWPREKENQANRFSRDHKTGHSESYPEPARDRH